MRAKIIVLLGLAACRTESLDRGPDGDEDDDEHTVTSPLISAGNTYAFARGCYSDQPTRALPVQLSAGASTIESCVSMAKNAGYTFAGVQYGGECWAGNTIGYNVLPSWDCITPCTANPNELCGGTWANSIYQMMTPGSTTWPGWESASTVASSWLFDAGWDSSPCGLYGTGKNKHCNLPISGTSTLTWNGQGATLVELRGWLTVDPTSRLTADPDYGWNLELDPEWAASHLGLVDLNPILKVGNILNMQKLPSQNLGTYSRAVATPMIHVELAGWRPSDHPGQQPPPDWQSYDNANLCPDPACTVLWPYNPSVFPSQPGKYVRMVGSLITDEPHCTVGGDLGDAITKWARSGCSGPFDSRNPARWTEMHSPDLIVEIPDPPNARDVTVTAVADVAENGLFSGETNTIDVDLSPPANQFVNGVCPGGVQVDERVGAETNYGTITDGNATLTGARIDHYSNHVHIHVTVHGEGGYGAPGKFKAIYKVSCAPCTPACAGRCGGPDSCGGTCPAQACGTNQVCGSDGFCTCAPGTSPCPALGYACASSCPVFCGDGVCDAGETCTSCPDDCGACPCPPGTSDCCGDGVCRTASQCRGCLQ
jgi:hypothetical protein